MNLTQTVSLKRKNRTLHLFCDASSTPPIVAAVLFQKRGVKYYAADVPANIVDQFHVRNDDHIMALELYAILCGVETFCSE